MEIRLSGIIKESIVDGPGIRYVVFTQGCPHHCEGCHNPDTHDFDGGYIGNTEEIIKDFQKNPLLSGITFSGGEPFCQPEPLLKLAKEVHNLKKNVISYSGYTFEELLKLSKKNQAIKDFMENIDYLIDGKFILSQKTLMLKFRGSKNQRIIDMKKSLEVSEAQIAEL